MIPMSELLKKDLNEKGELHLDAVMTMTLIKYLERVEKHLRDFEKIADTVESIAKALEILNK